MNEVAQDNHPSDEGCEYFKRDDIEHCCNACPYYFCVKEDEAGKLWLQQRRGKKKVAYIMKEQMNKSNKRIARVLKISVKEVEQFLREKI